MIGPVSDFPVFNVLIRLLTTIFRVKCKALLIFENIHLHAFVSEHLLVARGIGDITNYNPVELARVDQHSADVARAERRKDPALLR